ncbi:MAG: S9 family peptidase [Pyrinomonadaceae bacterium]|nr:S9 family peptidase [Acidobacteriota bacterium]MBP7377940.1 S9 family peptidase [Pyrinomonadaceae bacterium]
MKRLFSVFLFAIVISIAAQAQTTFTVNDLIAMKRVSDPQLSPDGKRVAFTLGIVDKAANRTLNQIYVMNIDGRNQRQVTKADKSSSNPRWSPDGKHIAYVHGGQIWTMEPDGDGREQVTKLSTGGSQPVWSPDGKWIAFSSDVYPECKSDECNKLESEKAENSKVKAKVTERLLFRHWTDWRDRLRTHVFVVSAKGGPARDVTPGDFDSPPYGAATGTDYLFSPDSSSIVYLRNPDRVEATSTNSDIYIQNLSGGAAKNITAGMKGYDASPMYTPDGKYLLFRSQQRATFEADRWRIMRYDPQSGEIVELTKGFDQQVDDMTISADGNTVFFVAGERGRSPIFSVPVEPDFRLRIATHVKKVLGGVTAGSLNVTRDGRTIVFSASSNDAPAEIMSVGADGEGLKALTAVNKDALANFGLRKSEEMDWKGALNTNVHGFLLKPANFDPAKKYPLIVLIHGGPQGAWSDNWGYRWNPQIFANQGYVVFMPNPRGSTGYGQKFVDDISADWGGKAHIDIANGVAEVVKKPFIDKTRIGAAGASYGGYMVDWLLGHNNDPRFKYKAFVSHAGVYNLESMATSTEEIWFVNWEFKGMPWENPVNYNKWSPHKFAKNFATPTLVTAGEIDYRVPVDQSYQLYTTLQLKNVPSKLIVFPDEGHWILKPQNSEFWYANVMDWFNKYLK